MAEAKAKPERDYEELLARLRDELKAELKAEMSEAKGGRKPIVKDPYYEELVEVNLFKDGRDYKDDVFVCVNGENCVIKRGVPVKVRRKFALELERSQRQNIRSAEYAHARQKEFEARSKEFNS